MPLEQLLRDQLSSATETVPGGPDLATSLHEGRRQRRVRTVSAVAGTTAAVAAIAIAATALTPDPGRPTAGKGEEHVSGESPVYPDFVSGPETDTTMQQTVSAYIPWIGWASNVYPSDWTRNDALPDQDFANATDWQAYYDNVGAHEQLVLIMGFNPPGERTRPGCAGVPDDPAPAAPHCNSSPIGAGVVTSSGYRISQPSVEGADTFTYITSYQIDGGFTVNALDRVVAPSWAAANAMRELDEATLSQLVTDPTLTFPEPAAWPK